MPAAERAPQPDPRVRLDADKKGRSVVGSTAEILVVVPARNEEQRIHRCLEALHIAVDDLARDGAGSTPSVRIVVVLDRCTDATAAIVARWPQVNTLHTAFGRVGTARAAGIAYGLGATAVDPAQLWIACTDADSAVPPQWLTLHLQFADTGADALLGTVRPNPEELSRADELRWVARHDLSDQHSHVHGANLGIRGRPYLQVGGFADLAAHEDVDLVDRLRHAGAHIRSTGAAPVTTSARLTGRTPTGFATYLQDLVGIPAATGQVCATERPATPVTRVSS